MTAVPIDERSIDALGARHGLARSTPRSCCSACVVALALVAAAPAHAKKLPAPPAKLSAASAAVYEASTGEPLYGLDAGERRLIASTTKLMTALPGAS